MRKVFAWPAALAIVTLAGLAAGLLGDGPFDVACWICFGIPIASLFRAWRRRRALRRAAS